MKNIIKLAALATLLSGCQIVDEYITPPTQTQPSRKPPIVVAPPVETEPEPPVIVELPPKQYRVDWEYAVNTLLGDLVSGVTLEGGNTLLIDAVKNNTSRYIMTQRLSETIESRLQQRSTFNLVAKSDLSQAKRALGLPADDKLVIRSKVLGLARYLNANYVLLPSVSGNPEQPTLTLQLMTVNTGEIVWDKSQNTAKVEVNDMVGIEDTY